MYAANNIYQSGTAVAGDNITVKTEHGDIVQQGGTLYAKQEISLTAAGMLNNKNGIIQGGKSSVKAGSTIDNTNGQIVADTLDMSADNINNTKGSIKIIGKNSNATIAADADILNTTGAIKTNHELKLTAGHNIANGNGTISSADSLTAKADKLSGTAGQILSGGDLDLSLQKDVINTGSIEAQNNLTLTTNGTITNQKNILSNTSLTLTAANITNTSSAQIQSGKVNLTSRGTLTNSGLINGGSQTYITGNTVNNNDTGRIYGDHLAVQANNLNNIAVYGGASPVIAARNKMDLGIAGTITNKEHASLISGGNLYIGGSLDASHNAVNKAGAIENSSAYIKASGDSSIAAGTIHNSNNHFSTANTLISTTHYDKASGSGNFLYPFSGYGEPADHSQAYIIFGGKIQHLHTPDNGDYTSFNTYSYNEYIYQDVITQSDPAQIISGGSMNITADTLINDKSSITAGKTLNAAVSNLQNIDGKGKQTVKDIGNVTSYWIHHPRFKADDTHTSTTDYNPADIITDITVPAVIYTGGTIPYNIAKPANNYSNIQMQNTATAAVNSIAIPTVDLRIPGSSLYSISKNVAANYIMETDPAYTNQQKFLSSDYFFQQMKQDPNYIQKRLGDGYYGEQLINDQVLELTGRRFLADYASDNEQYKALMDAAVKYAAADNTLKVGVALSK
ncbi:beta strand repeat-containing protein [Pectinatus brassicae]|uniref:Adhesin HecA-like repeat protein n=1 Tax=Pectinatus brassicae TaxID=862415 RepID=A0A840UR94_9FIRM|nr:S-layer family protein [Pectinatus brassicae]MBB5336682.1 adhesin HecA-like repeat protein [Pectinatus brassicae]